MVVSHNPVTGKTYEMVPERKMIEPVVEKKKRTEHPFRKFF